MPYELPDQQRLPGWGTKRLMDRFGRFLHGHPTLGEAQWRNGGAGCACCARSRSCSPGAGGWRNEDVMPGSTIDKSPSVTTTATSIGHHS